MSTKKKDTATETNQDRPVMILEKKGRGKAPAPRSRPAWKRVRSRS